jgi:hypothetical protein
MSTHDPIFPEAGPSHSHSRPSLFELIAQDQLRDLLHPVVRYVLSVSPSFPSRSYTLTGLQYFTHRYPRYLLRILNNHEEFYALLSLVLERHHLKKHSQFAFLRAARCVLHRLLINQMHLYPSTSTISLSCPQQLYRLPAWTRSNVHVNGN